MPQDELAALVGCLLLVYVVTSYMNSWARRQGQAEQSQRCHANRCECKARATRAGDTPMR
jgi:hypothetical protein